MHNARWGRLKGLVKATWLLFLCLSCLGSVAANDLQAVTSPGRATTPIASQLPTGGNPAAHEHGQQPTHEDHHDDSITHQMMLLVLQLAIILLVAKLCGEIFERYLKQPSVLGELGAGMLIGPFALGPHLHIFGVGPLFPQLEGAISVSPELYGIATVASIILLFLVGLETNFKQFLRYSIPGLAVGIGGVLGSFLTGNLAYCLFSGADFMSPAALFMGTVSTATSVGITARVLSEQKKLDSPEGTTILAGAVIDDVLGILILAVTAGIAAASADGGSVHWDSIGMIALKAFGFWLVATALGIWFAPKIVRGIAWFKLPGSAVALGLGLSLLLAGIAEAFGLAMIIGAYIMGLSLSKEPLAKRIERALQPVYACFVPIFFAVMGMLVNFEAMLGAFAFGMVYSLIAVVSKVIGSGLPALFVGFNWLGASRIGLGMLPRGEVALIVAGVGVTQGFIGPDMFGVVIMMTLITTVAAPPALIKLFAIRRHGLILGEGSYDEEKLLEIGPLTWSDHNMLISLVTRGFESEGFTVRRIDTEKGIYLIEGKVGEDTLDAVLTDYPDRLSINTNPKDHDYFRELTKRALNEAQQIVTSLNISEVNA